MFGVICVLAHLLVVVEGSSEANGCSCQEVPWLPLEQQGWQGTTKVPGATWRGWPQTSRGRRPPRSPGPQCRPSDGLHEDGKPNGEVYDKLGCFIISYCDVL